MSRRPFALLLAVLPVLAGCMHIYHKPCDEPVWRPSDNVPDDSKACVHVFLIDCYDPFAAGHLADVRDYLNGLGFTKTHYGWPHHCDDFQVDLGVIGAENPNARFVIVGCGTGAQAARRLAGFANTIGTPIDVLIYIDPNGLEEAEGDTALNTFVIRGETLAPSDGTFAGHVHSWAVATHPETLKIIEREVTLAGLSIPLGERPPAPPVFLVPPMPAPRDVIPIPKELPLEWRFLERRPPTVPPPPFPVGTETLPYPKLLPELPPPAKP
jgi:hypothetical protein